MTAYKEEHHNVIVKSAVENLIEKIKELEEEAEFEEVVRVLVKHLNNPIKYHPHHTVIVNSTFAELSEGKQSIDKIIDYVVDRAVIS